VITPTAKIAFIDKLQLWLFEFTVKNSHPVLLLHLHGPVAAGSWNCCGFNSTDGPVHSPHMSGSESHASLDRGQHEVTWYWNAAPSTSLLWQLSPPTHNAARYGRPEFVELTPISRQFVRNQNANVKVIETDTSSIVIRLLSTNNW